MIHGIFLGLILFSALVRSMVSGVQFYEPHGGMQGPVDLYICIIVVLVYSCALYLKRARALAQARRWPCVSGTIDEVVSEGSHWRIYYHYRVNDTPYSGSTFSLESPLADSTDVALHVLRKSFVEPHQLSGLCVRVYYNPKDANISVLHHVMEPAPWSLAIPTTVSFGALGLISFIIIMAQA